MVPIHPESVDDDKHTLRWAIPASTLGTVGVPDHLPAALQDLLEEQVLESVSVEPAGILTTIAPGSSWRDHGARVRQALQRALDTPEKWQFADTRSPTDDLLRMAVQQVIDGDVGDYIRSHGGHVALVQAHDHDVEVRLSGACSHCPASEVTLTERIETGIRALYPNLRRLSAHSDPTLNPARRLLRLLPTRSR